MPKANDSRLKMLDKMPLRHIVHFLPGYQLLFFILSNPREQKTVPWEPSRSQMNRLASTEAV